MVCLLMSFDFASNSKSSVAVGLFLFGLNLEEALSRTDVVVRRNDMA